MAEKTEKDRKSSSGRPTKYKPEYCEQGEKLCLLGATDKQIANFFKIDESTLTRWKERYPAFRTSLKESKLAFDVNVERSLYERAMGYSHPEDKIFNQNGEPLIVPTRKHYPPDTTAAIFWLKNRQPAKWRDKQEQEITGTLEHTVKPWGEIMGGEAPETE